MPRPKRFYLPGVPVHVVQRGNNRAACFFDVPDYERYLASLGEALSRYGAALHAYCLMTNHVHLLLTPRYEDSISRVIQHTGRQYVKYLNHSYRRTGTLWEGRHKGCLVEAESYLLACYRYIELNPVRAGMVNHPGDYRWSSYHCNALGTEDPLVTPHRTLLALGGDVHERRLNYQTLFQKTMDSVEPSLIWQATAANQVLGSAHFRSDVESALGISLGSGRRGRPPKQGVAK